jgi:hypothetical protein
MTPNAKYLDPGSKARCSISWGTDVYPLPAYCPEHHSGQRTRDNGREPERAIQTTDITGAFATYPAPGARFPSASRLILQTAIIQREIIVQEWLSPC